MRGKGSLIRLFGLVVLGVIVLAACVGGSGSAPSPVPLTAANCEPLAQHDRYRYRSVVTYDLAARAPEAPPESPDRGAEAFIITFDVDGAVENPDKTQAVVNYPVSGSQLPIIVIGNTTWNQVAGVWSSGEGAPPELFLPLRMCNALAPDVSLLNLPGEPVEINGIPTKRYHFDSLETGFADVIWGPGSDFGRLIDTFKVDLWLAEDEGYPVRQELEGIGRYENGRTLTVKALTEVKDINDKSIRILPPQ